MKPKKLGKTKFLVWFFIIVLIILVLWASAYIYSLSKIEIVSVNVDEIREFDFSGFTLNGNIEIYNGGIVPVKIDYVTYNIIMEKSEEQLSSGNIQGVKIKAKETEKIYFSSKVTWVPTAEIALGLITKGETFCKLSGIVYVKDLKYTDIKIPFETRFDIEPYIKQFIKQKIDEVVDTIADTFSRVVDGIVGLFT